MNNWIHLGRKLTRWAFILRPSSYSESGLWAWIKRNVAYHILQPIGQCLKDIGHRKYLDYAHSGCAWKEMREFLFRKLQLYVEGYLANIAHRYFDDAPKPMPEDLEVRRKWGKKVLETKSEDKKECCCAPQYYESLRKEGWSELKRIYQWLVEDRENWKNPYWKKAPDPDLESNPPLAIPEEDRPEWEYFTSRAERLDYIIRERTSGRAERLFDRRHLLEYD